MYYKFLPIIAITLCLFSCTNKYKITQTPDDVYYSPLRGISEESNNKEEYNSTSSSEHREIIMSRHDSRWRNFDNEYNCNYDPYHFGYSYGYYYNPFYYPYPVYNYGITPQNPKNSTPRTTNLGSYSFYNINSANPKTSGPVKFYVPGREYNNSNWGNNIRNILTPDPNASPSGGRNNTRTYSPSSSSGNIGGGSGTPIVRPSRNK